MMKSEKQLQEYFKKGLEGAGCLVFKFSSESRRGVPDLMVIPSDGKVFFAEMKSEKGRGVLSKLQIHQIAKIRAQGVDVFIVDNVNYADCIIRSVSLGTL